VASGSNYTFSGYVRNAAGGAVNSALTVTKNGAGTQVFSGQGSIVSYSGATTINGGVLEFSGTNSVANNSAITLSGGSVKFSGGGNRTRTIGGAAGSLIKAGDNTLTLGGTNTYAGRTVVEAGTLKLGTALAATNSLGFTMNGGVLDLNGFAVTNAVLDSSVAGPGGVVSNGTLAVTTTVTPGGSNTVGSVTLPGAPDLSGTLWVDVTSGGACDQLKVTGSLSVDKLNLRVVDTNLLDKASTYTIVQCAGGTAAGPFLSDNLPSSWEVSYQGDRIVLRFLGGTLIRVF
jgi:fibronectin-binding autotransporter adhesin